MTRLKFNQTLTFIHHLQLFISVISDIYLYQIGLGGVRMPEVALRYLIKPRVLTKYFYIINL